MKYYYDFKFGDKKLSDFGGTIYNSGDCFKRTIGGEPEHITLSIPNKGEIYYGTKLTPLQFEESVYFDRTIKGIEIANVTLHVGIGTFRPVKVENIEEHHMHSEHYYIKKEDNL